MALEMRVGDVMSRAVYTVRPETPVKDVARVMHDAGISGVPVVDEQDRLVGIVTEADLLWLEERPPRRHPRRRFLSWLLRPTEASEAGARAERLRAADVMSREVITVRPDTPVREAARLLLQAGVKRLPVVDDDGHVVGIVTRSDLLAPLLRSDEELRDAIRDELLVGKLWLDPQEVRVEVEDGVVTLEGEVEQRSLKELLVELVSRIDGVIGVVDRLTYRIDDRKVRPERREELGWGENWVRNP